MDGDIQTKYSVFGVYRTFFFMEFRLLSQCQKSRTSTSKLKNNLTTMSPSKNTVHIQTSLGVRWNIFWKSPLSFTWIFS